MPRIRSWTDDDLKIAVEKSRSIRSVLLALELVPAGGNYVQIKKRIELLGIDIAHFTGMGWNVGLQFKPSPAKPLEELLVENGTMQSFSLKKRLFQAGIKKPECELCGWSEMSIDGRIPVELDHINGKRNDNRLENLRVLCPNCHSLQVTHRGKNKKVKLTKLRAGVVTGSRD